MGAPLQLGDRGEEVRLMQAALNLSIRTTLKADGQFGPASQAAVKFLQRKHGFMETGQFGDAEYIVLRPIIDTKLLKPQDMSALARTIGADPALLMAIREVEGRGEGFLNDGRPLILFEGHQFYKGISARYGVARAQQIQQQFPNICYPKYDKTKYFGGAREYDRLERARTFDSDIACASASWGLMQVMGFNHVAAGWSNIRDYVAAMKVSEVNHMKAAIGYIRSRPDLLRAVRTFDYPEIARGYNGEGYASNQYDRKIANAHAKFSALFEG